MILILTDDMGYGDVGCYGGQFAPTPNLDRMAGEGVRFTQYYSASPICSPSRTGATTGLFPARWNITSYLQTRAGYRACEQADFLDPKAPSLARALKVSVAEGVKGAPRGANPPVATALACWIRGNLNSAAVPSGMTDSPGICG